MKQLSFYIAVASLLFAACNIRGGQENSNLNTSSIELPEPGGKVPDQPINPVKIDLPSDPLEGIDTISKLNPAHGEPGHRCDTPIGAELSTMPKDMGMSLCETNK